MDDLGVRAELGRAVDHAVVETRTDGEDHVSVVHGQVGGVAAVHAEHAEELAIAARIAAEAHQGIGHRQVEHARHFGQRIGSIAHDHAAAGVENRALGGNQHFRGFADLAGMTANCRVVGAQLDLLRIGVLELLGRVAHVLRNIDHYRAGTAGLGDIEGLLDHLGDFRGMLDDEAVLHDRAGDTDHVGFLEGVGTDHVARHLAGQDHHRNGVHVGGGDAGDGVGRARAGSHQHHTGLAGGAGVAVGHVGSSLLMTDQDVGHIVFFEQGIVDMQEGTTRVPIDVLNAFVTQRADDHFSAG
ncbi:hypothetical protein D3C78_310830 [compost metagenome]